MPNLLEIVGQDHALAQLQRAYAGPRRPHAFLFAGPDGVGKQTTAVEFARLLLCENPVAQANVGSPQPGTAVPQARLDDLPADLQLHQACGKCQACRTVSAGTCPDFALVAKELARFHNDPSVRDRKLQELSIDVIRQFLIDPAYRVAVGGRGKVLVVLEAELMSTEAQNSLLKTLEEPPTGVTLILLTANPQDLLPTTRSRCQLVRFSRLDEQFVRRQLLAAGVEEAPANFYAALSQGSIGLALQANADDMYAAKRALVETLAAMTPATEMAFSESLQKQVDRLSKLYIQRDKRQAQAGMELMDKKEKPKELAATVASRRAGQVILALLTEVFRDALAVACGHKRTLVNADQAQSVAALAKRFSPDELSEILAQLGRYEDLLWRNVSAKILWDNVAVTCGSALPLEIE